MNISSARLGTSARACRLAVAAVAVGALSVTTALPAAAAGPAASSAGRTSARYVADDPVLGKLTYEEWAGVELLRGVFERGDVSVVDRFVQAPYIQHNPQAPDGPEALKSIGLFLKATFPDETFRVVRVFSQGDLVVAHSNYVLVPGTPGRAVLDIMRFDHGKVVEHWDVVQDVPATSVNGNDMFSTLSRPRTSAPKNLDETARNKALVTAYVTGLGKGDLAVLDRYLAKNVIEHNPAMPSGAANLKAVYAGVFAQLPDLAFDVKRVVAEGDLVAVHAHLVAVPGTRGRAVGEIFRVKDGRIVEIWSSTQDVPETALNDNTMF